MSVVEDDPDGLMVVVPALRPGHPTPAEGRLVAVPSLPPRLPSGQGPVPGTEGWTLSTESLIITSWERSVSGPPPSTGHRAWAHHKMRSNQVKPQRVGCNVHLQLERFSLCSLCEGGVGLSEPRLQGTHRTDHEEPEAELQHPPHSQPRS